MFNAIVSAATLRDALDSVSVLVEECKIRLNEDDLSITAVDLAGDENTFEETADVLSEVTGVDVEAVHVPIEDAYETFGEEFTVMCEWFNEVGYSADIEALDDQFGFAFADLETYLRTNGWETKGGMASVPGWVKAMQ